MNRRLLRFLSVAVVLAATSASHAGNVVWNNTIGGNWSATGNWNPHRVPTSTDVAIITNNGNYTVTVDIDADVGGLILGYTNATAQVLSANGKVFSLSGAATINPSGRFNLTASSFNSDTNGSGATISGTLNASSAVLSGRMTLATNGIMTFSNTGSSFNSLALTNNGTVNWYQANLTNTGTSIVVNEGVWDAKTNNSLFSSSGTIAFNNHGTLRKSGGFLTDSNGTSFGSGVVFSNTGSLDILSGKLTAQNVNVSGTFNINSNAALELYGTLRGGPVFSGNGLLSGYLIGSNAVINGTVTLSWGNLIGALTIASNATLNLDGRYGIPTFYDVLFTNYGTVNWQYTDLTAAISPQIFNYGLWTAQSNSTFSGSGLQFNNYGTFRKTGIDVPNYGTTFGYNMSFNNFGTVDIQAGILSLNGGAETGSFTISNGASLYLASCIFAGNNTFSGSGIISGFFNGDNAVFHGTLTHASGYWLGSFTIASNTTVNLDGRSGTISFSSTLFTNYGTVNWQYATLNSSASSLFNNYGLWIAQSNATFSGTAAFNNYGTFRKTGIDVPNYGTTFEANVAFNNFGTAEIQAGILSLNGGTETGAFIISNAASLYLASCTFTGDNTFTGNGIVKGYINGNNAIFHGTLTHASGYWVGSFTILSNATVNLDGRFGAITFFSTLFTNSGTVNWQNTPLTGSGGTFFYNYGLWTAQSNAALGGDATFNNYGTFRKSGQKAGGATSFGVDTTFVNTGTIDVQVDQLAILGTFGFISGRLNFGISSSSNFGSLQVPQIIWAGELSANFNNAYSPVLSNSFPLVSYNSLFGMFTNVSLPHLSPTLRWTTNYSAHVFTLGVIARPSLTLLPAAALNQTNFTFSWNSGLAETYQVQYTTNLAPANWINLGNTIDGTNGAMTISDGVDLNRPRFYRLMLLP